MRLYGQQHKEANEYLRCGCTIIRNISLRDDKVNGKIGASTPVPRLQVHTHMQLNSKTDLITLTEEFSSLKGTVDKEAQKIIV